MKIRGPIMSMWSISLPKPQKDEYTMYTVSVINYFFPKFTVMEKH